MPLTPHCLDLWSLILLNRPGSRAELAELAGLRDLAAPASSADAQAAGPGADEASGALPEHLLDRLDVALTNLVEAGLVVMDGDRPEPVPAEVATAGLATELLASRAEADRRTDALLGALFERLPRLVRDQELGRSDEGWLRLHAAHGPYAPRDVTMQTAAGRRPVPTCAVLPDVTKLQLPPPEFQEPFMAALAQKDGPDRILVTTEGARLPAAQEALAVYAEAGVLFRMRSSLPSWFGVEEDDVVALPLDWGQAWPTSVVAMQHSGVAGVARAFFESLWLTAEPLHTTDRSWGPLLRLMAQGATLEAASRALGVTDRTGRRRVAAAMEHYGTSTLFELGTAFGRELPR